MKYVLIDYDKECGLNINDNGWQSLKKLYDDNNNHYQARRDNPIVRLSCLPIEN